MVAESKNKAEWYVLKKQELLFGQQGATHMVANGLGIWNHRIGPLGHSVKPKNTRKRSAQLMGGPDNNKSNSNGPSNSNNYRNSNS